jgi:hypothetical protein
MRIPGHETAGRKKEGVMRVGRGRRYALVLLVAVLSGGAAAVLAQTTNPNERTVKPRLNALDTDGIWVLDFKFRDPRILKVNVPGRGQKVCWYLWYQVTNNDPNGLAHTFIPDFELVTHDKDKAGPPRKDQILPAVEDEIRRIEDPYNYLKIKNSVTISKEPIPPTRKNAVPRPVTGVAIWDDVDPESNYFSIFVAGLSNGWAVTDPIPPDTKYVVRRKTLQLNFRRFGDKYLQKSEEIRFVQPEQWIYRGSKLELPGVPGQPPKENK